MRTKKKIAHEKKICAQKKFDHEKKFAHEKKNCSRKKNLRTKKKRHVYSYPPHFLILTPPRGGPPIGCIPAREVRVPDAMFWWFILVVYMVVYTVVCIVV